MKNLCVILLMLFTLQGVAQQFDWKSELQYNKIENTPGSYVNYYFLEGDTKGFSRLVVQKSTLIANPQIFIESFDSDFGLKDSKMVYNGIATNKMFVDVILKAEQIHLFTALPDNSKKTFTLKAQVFDYQGTVVKKEKDLDVIKDTKTITLGEFYVAVSENGKNYATIGIPVYKKKTNEIIQVRTFDENFEETFGADINLNFPRKRFVNNRPFILNDGTMYVHKHRKIKKVGRVQELYLLDKPKKTLLGKQLKLSKGKDFVMLDDEMMENESGNLVMAGLQKKDAKMQAPGGVYYIEFDNKGALVNEVIADFPNKPSLGFTGLKIKDIKMKGEEIIFFSHQYSSSSFKADNASNYTYSHRGSNMIITRINKEGLVNSTFIKRSEQEEKASKDRRLDFVWMYDEGTDDIIVIYNQMTSIRLYPKNPLLLTKINRPVVVYISKEGDAIVKNLFDEEFESNPREKSFVFGTEEFYQVGNNLIVKTHFGDTYKYGVFYK